MFSYDDIARVKADAPKELRPGDKCWIIGVFPPAERSRLPLPNLPQGTIYTVEFEGGDAADMHEDHLESWPGNVR